MSIEDPRIARLREEIEIDVEDGLPNSMSSISAIQYLLAAYDDQRRKIDAVERLMAVKSHDDGIPSYYNERLRAALTTIPEKPEGENHA
jgi:hypothetical protein